MSESNLNSPTVSFVDSTSINKASYLRFNTSSSPLWLKCVQLKDFKGLEMCGTNTLIEKIATGEYHKGEVVEVEFKQRISIAPGKYTLSFSCTHFNHRGELEVLNRK